MNSSGDATFDGTGTFLNSIDVNNNAVIGGLLDVNGVTTFANTISVSGNTTLNSSLNVANFSTFNGGLKSKNTSVFEKRISVGMSTVGDANEMLKIECSDATNCDYPYENERYGIYSIAKDATAANESAIGIYGEGTGENAYGLRGSGTGVAAYGVHGLADSNDEAYGVFGEADGYLAYGVYGKGVGGFARYGLYGIAENGYANYGVYGKAQGGSYDYAGYFSGDVYVSGTLYNPSDERFKRNIQQIQKTDIAQKVVQLNPSSYEYLTDAELKNRNLPELNASQGTHFGLVAQELEQVFPELVKEIEHFIPDAEGKISENSLRVKTKAINYQELIVVLIAALQEQDARIKALEEALLKAE